MNEQSFSLAEGFVDEAYVAQARQSRRSREAKIRALLANRNLPEDGWDETTVRLFLAELASMDSNNFPGNVGVGEREGRVYSTLVRDRNFSLHHGIGRSGDIGATQPKAAGSSLVSKLAARLALDAVKCAGFKSAKHAAVLPVATGMALTLVLCALRQMRPASCSKVLFPRIDQKSCVKCVLTAGYELVVVENLIVGDEVSTNLEQLQLLLEEGADQYLCILTTTSCFAPRVPDRLVEIAELCQQYGVPHVVNNAYGVQSARCMGLIDAACRRARVDVVVQSTDKNFLVPVGGSVLTSVSNDVIGAVYKTYPGRASVSPSLDLFITLLSMGRQGWLDLLGERTKMLVHLRQRLSAVAEQFGERVLDTAENEISVAMTLSEAESRGIDVTFLGSMLFSRLVSGARVVPRVNKKTKVCDIEFPGGFGAHCAAYPVSYLTIVSPLLLDAVPALRPAGNRPAEAHVGVTNWCIPSTSPRVVAQKIGLRLGGNPQRDRHGLRKALWMSHRGLPQRQVGM